MHYAWRSVQKNPSVETNLDITSGCMRHRLASSTGRDPNWTDLNSSPRSRTTSLGPLSLTISWLWYNSNWPDATIFFPNGAFIGAVENWNCKLWNLTSQHDVDQVGRLKLIEDAILPPLNHGPPMNEGCQGRGHLAHQKLQHEKTWCPSNIFFCGDCRNYRPIRWVWKAKVFWGSKSAFNSSPWVYLVLRC